MKIIFRLFIVSSLFFSCKKDNPGIGAAEPVVATKIEIIDGKDGDFIAFDSQYRVIERANISFAQDSSKQYYNHVHYKYLSNMTIKTRWEFNGIDSTAQNDTIYTQNGVYLGDTIEQLTYSSDNYLTQVHVNDKEVNLTIKGIYQNGNLVKEEVSESSYTDRKTNLFTYNMQKTDSYRLLAQAGYFQNLMGSQANSPLYGKANKNLITGMNSNGFEYYFKYDLDNLNRPVRIGVYEGGVGGHLYRTYTVNYLQ